MRNNYETEHLLAKQIRRFGGMDGIHLDVK